MKQKEHWITIFVHGTYGPNLLFHPLAKVLKKHNEERLYKVVQQLLKHKILFRRQFMPPQGLDKIEKCFEKNPISLSITNAYQKVSKLSKSNKNNTLYAFGWNGKLNQKDRQLAAIKLYNSICKEIERYKEKSIIPKIQLICFSHGGNLCLNLAGIHKILNMQTAKIEAVNENERKALSELKKQIKEDSNKNTNSLSNNIAKNLSIDKLVLFATPIQQETEFFCFYPFFKKIYNFYSENDIVQISDIASTKGKNKRTINTKNHTKRIPCITQIRITINHNLKNNQNTKSLLFYKDLLTNDIKANLNSILRGGMPFPKHPYDPGHLDFWGVSLNKAKTLFEPLPLIIFTPIFLSIIKKNKLMNNLNINIKTEKENILFIASNRNKTIKKDCSIPLKSITSLKNSLNKTLEPNWHKFLIKTKKNLSISVFNFLNQYKILNLFILSYKLLLNINFDK